MTRTNSRTVLSMVSLAVVSATACTSGPKEERLLWKYKIGKAVLNPTISDSVVYV